MCGWRMTAFWVVATLAVGAVLMPVLVPLFRRAFSAMSSQTYAAGSLSMVFVTVPTMETGQKLAAGLVRNKLAACVNIIPGLRSVYEWKGKVEEEEGELLLMAKTRTDRVDELAEFVRENHPYDVAEVISSPIENGNPPYLNWVSEVVVPGK